MPTFLFLSTINHHGDAGDPYLLEWIKQRLDNLVDLNPWVIVGLLGFAILIIPVLTVCLYGVHRRRLSADDHPDFYR